MFKILLIFNLLFAVVSTRADDGQMDSDTFDELFGSEGGGSANEEDFGDSSSDSGWQEKSRAEPKRRGSQRKYKNSSSPAKNRANGPSGRRSRGGKRKSSKSSAGRKQAPAKNYKYDWTSYNQSSSFFSGIGKLAVGSLTGEVQLEGRVFQDAVDEAANQNLSLFSRVEMPYESSGGAVSGLFQVAGRVDALDSGRNIIYPEDFWLGYGQGFFRLRAGFQIYSWSHLEIFRPAELINSVNFDSDIENQQRIGELALSLQMRLQFGFLELNYMPLFLDPKFPGPKSRFNLVGNGVEIGDPIVVKKDGVLTEAQLFHQFAARFTKSFGDADLSLFFVDQVDRRLPELVLQSSTGKHRPVFFPMASFGASLTYAHEGWLLKAESVRRLVTNPTQTTIFGDLEKPSHSVLALGAEYSLPVGQYEVATFAEFQTIYGLNAEVTDEQKQGLSIFQNDAALGFRFKFNDVQGRLIKVLAIVDLEKSSEILGSISYEQRVGENFKIQAGYHLVSAPPVDEDNPQGLERFDGSGYGSLQVSWFF